MACLGRMTFEIGNVAAGNLCSEMTALDPANYSSTYLGVPEVQSLVVKNGTYALKIPSSDPKSYVQFECAEVGDTSVHYHKFWFRFHRVSPHVNTQFWRMWAGSGYHVKAYLNSSDQIVVVGPGSTPSTQTSTSTVTADVWHEVQIECLNANSPDGYIKIWVDGVSFIDLSSADLYNSIYPVAIVILGHDAADCHDLYYDDYFLNDDTGATHNTMPAVGRSLLVLLPNGDGDVTDWTPSSGGTHYTEVNEVPVQVGTTSTRVYSGTLDEQELFQFASASEIISTSADVLAVHLVLHHYRGTTPRSKGLLHTHSTDYLSTNELATASSSAKINAVRWETNPNTSNVWTVEEVDDCQGGAQITTGHASETCNIMFSMLLVEYTPVVQNEVSASVLARVKGDNDAELGAKALIKLPGIAVFRVRHWMGTTSSGGNARLRHLQKLDGEMFLSTYDVVGTATSLNYHDLIMNPVTLTDWLTGEIDTLQIGAEVTAEGGTARLISTFVVVEHEEVGLADATVDAKALVTVVSDVIAYAKVGYINIPGDTICGAKVGFFGGYRIYPVGPASRQGPLVSQRILPSPNP